MTKRTTEDALAELASLAADMSRLAKLQTRRREVLLECRAADPPVPIARLAEVCGTSTVAINVALNKARAAASTPKRARKR